MILVRGLKDPLNSVSMAVTKYIMLRSILYSSGEEVWNRLL